ncbi:MAG: DMT family transporter [Reyranella sp.]|uniref:DMT family transporter n=1 Tax=Reyranella sp. TaxID=1929291 RepID=UPI00272F6CC2|nr:DMT family transporter [Reyranella sp.]MDP1964547.1 DMT family transporter [Reyranella sp.]MDP2373152.1 DMT family transporter [Reyranella sp.]
MRAREWSLLVLLSILWGGSFFFAKVALAELGPFTIVFFRVALAALALNIVASAIGASLWRAGTPWRQLLVMGALNNALPFSLIFWGQTTITSGLASILNATTPLFTAVVAHIFTRDERMTVRKLVGVLAGLAGVAILIGPDLGGSLWGQIACLAAALSYAFAGIYGRRFKALGVQPLQAAAGQLTASAILILPIMLLVEPAWTAPSAVTWGAVASLALLSTALAYVIYFRILAAAGATNLLLVTFLIPVTAILLGAAFLGERLELRQFAGMGLIGLGLAAIDGRIAARLRAAK